MQLAIIPGGEIMNELASIADDVTRALPHALGPEKSILSSMLQDPQEFIGRAMEAKLTMDHFYMPGHAALFGILLEMFHAGAGIEFVGLTQALHDAGKLDRIGGPSAMADLHNYAPSSGHFHHHLKLVKDKATLRRIVAASNAAIAACYDAPGEASETLEAVEREIMAIRDDATTVALMTTRQAIETVLDDFRDELQGREDRKQGIKTGYIDLDRMTGGMIEGQMTVIGARPSMGKTSLAMDIVENVVMAGFPALVFSAEMTTKALAERMLFSRARFDRKSISRGATANTGDLQRIQRAAVEISQAKLFFDDTSGPSIGYIRAKARRMVREHGIKLIAVDYLGLCKSSSKQADHSREREVAEISAGLKGLAKDLSIPVVVVAQLNRKTEDRGGKSKPGKPRMSDLKDSGSIEADADIIALLYREDYYAEADEKADCCGRATLEIAKNRNGATGEIPLVFIPELTRFETGEKYERKEPNERKSRYQ